MPNSSCPLRWQNQDYDLCITTKYFNLVFFMLGKFLERSKHPRDSGTFFVALKCTTNWISAKLQCGMDISSKVRIFLKKINISMTDAWIPYIARWRYWRHIGGILPKGPYPIGPFWQDTLDMSLSSMRLGFQLPASFKCWEMINIVNMFSYFCNTIQYEKG